MPFFNFKYGDVGSTRAEAFGAEDDAPGAAVDGALVDGPVQLEHTSRTAISAARAASELENNLPTGVRFMVIK
jgi:hypothetical protein